MQHPPVYKQGKLRTQLLPADALIETAKAFEQGAVKHGARNWEVDGKHYTDVYGALMRHAYDWFDGKDADEESGLDPMAHVVACALMLIAMKKRGIGKDDRILHRQLEMPLQARLDKAFEEIENQNREAADAAFYPGEVIEIEVGLRFRLEKNHPTIWEITEVHGDKFHAKDTNNDIGYLQWMTVRAIGEVVKRPSKTSLRCTHCPNDALPGREVCLDCGMEGEVPA